MKLKPKTKAIFRFLLFELIFIPVVSILLAYYGPFHNVRDTLVTTAMTTINHKYLATWFLSDEKIAEIMEKNNLTDANEEENTDQIKISDQKGREIELIDIKKDKFAGKLLIVHDPSLVRVGTTSKIGETGMTLSQIVSAAKAVAGVNAGGFADEKMTGTGGRPTGIIMENGKVKYCEDETQSFDIIGFNDQDILILSKKMTIKEAQEAGMRDVISFGPPLIINGKGLIKSGNGGWGIQPRTAIGQRQDGSVLLLVIDGRQASSVGASLKDIQNLLLEYDAYNAANLDGGSSSTMVADGKVVNRPSDIMGERSIASAFIVMKR